MEEIVRASAWNGLREMILDMGGDPDDVFAAAHVEPSMLLQGETYLPLRMLVDTLEIASKRLGRKDFGLEFGRRVDPSRIGALYVAAVNSPTARAAFELAGRFWHVHSPAVSISLEPVRGGKRELVRMRIELSNRSGSHQYFERQVSAIHRALNSICGPVYKPREVLLPTPQLSPLVVYRKVFGILPRFEQPEFGVVVDSSVLDADRPVRSSRMFDVAGKFLETASPGTGQTLTGKVAQMAESMLRRGEYSPEAVALALGLHHRTLQRRLKTEGTTFEAIKDAARRMRAGELLAQDDMPVAEIAAQLSYSDVSAFSRSCRRWFGRSPRSIRAMMAGGSVRMLTKGGSAT